MSVGRFGIDGFYLIWKTISKTLHFYGILVHSLSNVYRLWGSLWEISKLGPSVLTLLSFDQYSKVSVLDFPVKTSLSVKGTQSAGAHVH